MFVYWNLSQARVNLGRVYNSNNVAGMPIIDLLRELEIVFTHQNL